MGRRRRRTCFVFDADRKLRYEGRFDNNFRIEAVKTHEAREAVDALLLAHKDPAVTHIGVFGCSTKWAEKESQSLDTMRKIESQPVKLEMATAEDLKKLRANATGKFTVSELLGDLVRFVHSRDAGFAGYVPDVQRARISIW